jgi:transposase
MDLTNYYDLISSESKAKKYLLGKCFKNHQRFCPRCRQRKLYKLQSQRYRCSSCDYTFHDFSGRWINHGRLTCVQWLSLIKLFELEVSVRKMAQQMKLSYRTVYRAVRTIRMAILSHAADSVSLLEGEIELMSPISEADEKATGAVGLLAKFRFSAFRREKELSKSV